MVSTSSTVSQPPPNRQEATNNMVKVGDFTVELVAADTKVAFKEHTASDGQVYAEVEPDIDYFISVGSNIGGVQANIWVDGVDLGYTCDFFRPKKKAYHGKWEIKGGKDMMTALHFSKTREVRGVAPEMLTGKVQVDFYEMGAMYYEAPGDYVSVSLTADSTLGGKKCIKSTTNGSHSFEIRSSKSRDFNPDNEVAKCEIGKHIRTITLHYCSALGLIYHKILPPPPALEGNDTSAAMGGRKKRKRSTPPSYVVAAAVSPEENINAAVKTENIGQETVTVQLTYDLVDLTADD